VRDCKTIKLGRQKNQLYHSITSRTAWLIPPGFVFYFLTHSNTIGVIAKPLKYHQMQAKRCSPRSGIVVQSFIEGGCAMTQVSFEVIAKPHRTAAPDLSRYPPLALRIHETGTSGALVSQSKCSLLGILVCSCSSSPSSAMLSYFVDSRNVTPKPFKPVKCGLSSKAALAALVPRRTSLSSVGRSFTPPTSCKTRGFATGSFEIQGFLDGQANICSY
jgi:hypothetical protein